MSTHNICLYTGDCTIIGVCMVIRSNMVTFFIASVLTLTGTVLVFRWSVDLLGGLFGDKSRIFFYFYFSIKTCDVSNRWGASNEYPQCTFLWRIGEYYSRIIIKYFSKSSAGPFSVVVASINSIIRKSRQVCALFPWHYHITGSRADCNDCQASGEKALLTHYIFSYCCL